MYNTKDVQFVGMHDYDKVSAKGFADNSHDSFSVGIFQWVMKSKGKQMKRSKVLVRISGHPSQRIQVFELAESIVLLLDLNLYTGVKNVKLK